MTRKGNFPAFKISSSDWMYFKCMYNDSAENKKYNALECKLVSKLVRKRSPFLPLAEKHHVTKIITPAFDLSKTKMCEKLMANALDSTRGGGGDFFCAGDNQAMKRS